VTSPAAVRRSLADAEPTCWWLDDVDAPDPQPPLAGTIRTDLAVVGGGYSGLWTALLAKQRDPSREVVLLEGRTVGWAASGRNGGFCSASLTHGQANGMDWYPADMPRLERLGRTNLAGIVDTIGDFAIDCKLERTGEMRVATQEYQLEDIAADYERMLDFGDDAILLDGEATRKEVASPTYLGAVWSRDKTVLVDPARLVWGLADACRSLGVRIHEHSHVQALESDGEKMVLTTAGSDGSGGSVRADRVALGTNAFPSLLRRVRPYVIPVYDYAMATEPLSDAQLASIRWPNRQGIGDSGNQFHYYRLTDDNCIIWGGYDAIYHFAGRIDSALDQRPATYARLATPLLRHLPPAGGVAIHPHLGRRDRHLFAVLPVLRIWISRASGTCHRVHRARGGSVEVRRSGDARPAVRASDRADVAQDGAVETGAVPAGTVAVGGGQPDPLVDGQGRRQTEDGATCGSGRSTDSVWGSTHDPIGAASDRRDSRRPPAATVDHPCPGGADRRFASHGNADTVR
jgi:glycine/D-amino acid oxidase-like deaminating enzyme